MKSINGFVKLPMEMLSKHLNELQTSKRMDKNESKNTH